jgi:hypothetical protein
MDSHLISPKSDPLTAIFSRTQGFKKEKNTMAVYLNLELENTVDIEKDDYLVLCFLNCSCFLLTHEDFCLGRDSQFGPTTY